MTLREEAAEGDTKNEKLNSIVWFFFCVLTAIRSHSPAKPVLIFVSSRRQTRLTALELIAFLATEDDPKQWLNMDEREVNFVLLELNELKLKFILKNRIWWLCSCFYFAFSIPLFWHKVGTYNTFDALVENGLQGFMFL